MGGGFVRRWRDWPQVRVVAWAFGLVGGEALGFALGEFASAWPWLAAAGAWCAVAAHGWRWRLPSVAWVAFAGVLLGARMEARARAVLSPPPGAWGKPQAFELTVEETLAERRTADGRAWCSFASTAEVVPVTVIVPRPRGGSAPAVGERWRCRGRFSRGDPFGGRWGRRKFWVLSEDDAVRVADARASVRALFARCAESGARRVSRGLSRFPDLAAFNQAILLGRRAAMAPSTKRTFADAGTMHVFAISGLHVMLVAKLCAALLARAGLGPGARGWLVVPAVAFYVALTGARPSAVRAALMAAAYLLAPAFDRKPDATMAWSWAALAVHGLDPRLVFDAGCNLSFAVTFGLVLWIAFGSGNAARFAGLKARAEEACAAGDRSRAEDLLALRRRRLRMVDGFAVSAVAWAAGTPLCARTFGRVSLGSLAANALVVPLAEAAVGCGLVGLVVGDGPVGVAFNALAAGCAWAMAGVSGWVARLPMSAFSVTPWAWWFCLFWWCVAVCVPLLVRHLVRMRRSVAACGACRMRGMA